MKIHAIYVWPQANARVYFPLARRFADSYRQFPPGHTPFNLTVALNGGDVSIQEKRIWTGIPLDYFIHTNLGWDIGAFQAIADRTDADLMICLGAPIHFYRAGWLDRMVDAWVENGPGIYGCWGYQYPHWHIRTTAFWIDPVLFKSYPVYVGSARPSRYAFEHGPEGITEWLIKTGFEARAVSWDKVMPHSQWNDAEYGIGHCLVLDQHTHR